MQNLQVGLPYHPRQLNVLGNRTRLQLRISRCRFFKTIRYRYDICLFSQYRYRYYDVISVLTWLVFSRDLSELLKDSPGIINVSHECWFLVFLFHCCISIQQCVDIKSRQEKFKYWQEQQYLFEQNCIFNLRWWPEYRRLWSRVQYRKRIESAIFS